MPKTLNLNLVGYIQPDEWLFPGDAYYPPGQGISFKRLQTAVQKAGEFDEIEIDLDSGGGVIEEGWRCYDYLKGLGKPIKVRSVGIVASMATVLMMLGDERLLSPHAKFTVHQPSGGIDGNINDIRSYLDSLESEQARLLEVYAQRTGKPDTELAELLADGKDHEYTAQQALDYGWITGIYETTKTSTNKLRFRPIMAHLSDGRQALEIPQQQSDNSIMSKLGKRLLAAFGVAQAVANGQPLKNIVVDTADGKKLDIETTGDTYVIGDAVKFDDGSDVPDGDYILSDGNTITVADGSITAISEPTEDAEQPTEEAQPTASVEDGETVTISKAEFDRLKASETSQTALAAKVGEHDKLMARLKPVLDAMAKTESKDPLVNRLPETPVERRVPSNEDPVLALSRQRQQARKK
ncbi:ATP-dependent Clp protease proteolytic subunit [Spirosoma daeguense]